MNEQLKEKSSDGWQAELSTARSCHDLFIYEKPTYDPKADASHGLPFQPLGGIPAVREIPSSAMVRFGGLFRLESDLSCTAL